MSWKQFQSSQKEREVNPVGVVSSGKPGSESTNIERMHIIRIIYVRLHYLFILSANT